MLNEQMKQFFDRLTSINALRFGDFTLASGAKSNFYIDLRYLPSYPDLYQDLIGAMFEQIRDTLSFDIIIGIPLAGVPFATSLSWRSKKPLHLLRKISKSHGLKKLIEGPPIDGKQVLLVDDLISSGHSKEFAINAIRDEGGEVSNLLVLINRGTQEFSKWEKEWKIKIHSLYDISPALLEEYRVKHTN
ncbi:MAG: orotate phosphoribosyltransferase [Candidatus Kariarchaeaceae archaeon]|jgi:orotate phosphoribosyltransferase